MDSMSWGEGLPVTSSTRSSWFMVEVPGKMGLPLISSPRMQPVRDPREGGGGGGAQDMLSTAEPRRASAVAARR
jgi:hypothetical protein